MDTRTLSIGLVSLVLVAGAGAWAFALPGEPPKPAAQRQPKAQEKDGDEEEVITLDKAPEAVRAAATKLAGDAKNITKVIKEEDEEDVVRYEVEYNEGTLKCSATFSTAGDLLESEKATTEAKLPAAAMAALRKDYPKATFANPFAVTKMFYEVEVVIDGKKHEVRVDAAGGVEDKSKHDGDEKGDKGKDDEGHAKAESPAKGVRGTPPGADGWAASFAVNKADLSSTGTSAYFVLQPGHVMTYAGGDTVLVITVLDQTKVLDGITTRIVEERETKGGVLVEVSKNYFAIEPKSGDVYYFGEDVDMYKDGKVINHEGTWLAGVDGASFGLFIPGSPKLGAKFYQEIALGNALDRFEIVSITDHLKTGAGDFDRVVKAEETTPLEAGKSYKWFAPGVGMIRDGELTLTKIEPAKGK